jgi:hypothetical protein
VVDGLAGELDLVLELEGYGTQAQAGDDLGGQGFEQRVAEFVSGHESLVVRTRVGASVRLHLG